MQYTDEYLLNRAYDELKRTEEANTKITMKKPLLGMTPTKTSIINFKDIRDGLNRDEKHFAEYLSKELAMETQLNERGELIVIGRCRQSQVERLISKYIKEYVKCQQCRSGKTDLFKKDRVWCMLCNSCNSMTYK